MPHPIYSQCSEEYHAIEVEQETNTRDNFVLHWGCEKQLGTSAVNFKSFTPHVSSSIFSNLTSIGFPFGDYAIAGRKRNISVAPDSAALSSVKTLINVDLQRIPLEGDEMLRSMSILRMEDRAFILLALLLLDIIGKNTINGQIFRQLIIQPRLKGNSPKINNTQSSR